MALINIATFSYRTQLVFFCHLLSLFRTSMDSFGLLDSINTIVYYYKILVIIPTKTDTSSYLLCIHFHLLLLFLNFHLYLLFYFRFSPYSTFPNILPFSMSPVLSWDCQVFSQACPHVDLVLNFGKKRLQICRSIFCVLLQFYPPYIQNNL